MEPTPNRERPNRITDTSEFGFYDTHTSSYSFADLLQLSHKSKALPNPHTRMHYAVAAYAGAETYFDAFRAAYQASQLATEAQMPAAVSEHWREQAIMMLLGNRAVAEATDLTRMESFVPTIP